MIFFLFFFWGGGGREAYNMVAYGMGKFVEA